MNTNFPTTYTEVTHLINMYLNIEEMAKNRKNNEFPRKEGCEHKHNDEDEPNL